MEVMDPNDLMDTSMFYSPDDFPPLPDFPCMSSSSSSSFTRAPAKTPSSSSATSSPPLSTSSSSSSAASWAVLRSDQEADRSPQPPKLSGSLSSSASMEVVVKDQQFHGVGTEDALNGGGDDCLDVMETFGYMDLLECNDLFDPASIFNGNETGNNSVEEFQPEEQKFLEKTEQYQLLTPNEERFEAAPTAVDGGDDGGVQIQGMTDEMGEVFLDWLRTNRESISAEDLRRIKIKKSTIESAARRLGGGKAAMKQLLKLILEWVQTSHLQRKRKEAEAASIFPYLEPSAPPPPFFQNPSFMSATTFSEPNYPQQPWMAAPQVGFDQSAPLMAAQNNSFVGYMAAGDPFSGGGGGGDMYPPAMEFHMLDSTPTWQVPHHQMAAQPHYNFVPEPAMQTPAAQAGFCGYGNNGMYGEYQQPFYTNSNTLNSQAPSMTRFGSSATKEARKKRMARQRRLLSHHRGGGGGHHHGHHISPQLNGHQNMQMAADQPHARLGSCDLAPPNWMYWPAQAAAPPQLPPPEAMTQVHNVPVDRPPTAAMQGQNCQRQGQPDRRQGWKVENNLKFLLQKVLKQSDVGNLGRIVLPKKEAETHLPELEARDGIAIAMEDIGTSRVWNMRYRFWPNNKSRMYLLENTGDFVRTNGLQEGDFIVIYSDVKCGKYLIRGVKVRPADANKTVDVAKRLEKSQRNLQGNACSPGNGALSQRR